MGNRESLVPARRESEAAPPEQRSTPAKTAGKSTSHVGAGTAAAAPGRRRRPRAGADAYRAAFENTPLALLVVGPRHRVRDANAAACKLLSMAKRELVGSHLRDLGLEGMVGEEGAARGPLARGAESRARLTLPGGAAREAQCRWAPLSQGLSLLALESPPAADDPAAAGILASSSAVLDHFPGALLVLDARTRGIRYASRGIEALGLRPPSEFTASPGLWLELIPPDEVHAVHEQLDAVLASGRPVEFRFRWRLSPPDDLRVIEGRFAPVLDARGEAARLEGLLVDVTGQENSEDRMRRAEARYRDLFDHAPDGLHVLDPDLRFLEINETELHWLGYGHGEVIGRMRLQDVVAPEDRRTVEEHCRQLLERGHAGTLEVRMTRRDGSTFPARLHLAAVPPAPERPRQIRATVWEITHEHELLHQLYLAQRMESLGTLVGGVAHDFNNLLTAIRGYTELAAARVEGDPLLSRYLADIKEASDSAASLTRQLLAFGRRQALDLHLADLGGLVAQFAKILRRLIGENVELAVTGPAAPLYARVDVTQIHQVLMNLAVNARDAMGGSGRLTLEVSGAEIDQAFLQRHSWARRGSYVRITVSDTGPGIPEEAQSRIFEPFFTTKQLGQGTGLGLAVVYGVVKQHEGFIRVDSAPGRGATFEIFLPLSPSPQIEEPLKEDLAPPPGGSETLLVAEDDALIRKLIHESLTGLGYQVLLAADGEEALEVFDRHRGEADLVIMDVVMPRRGGLDAAERMLAAKPDLKILLVTGYRPDQASHPPLGGGPFALIEKPCSPQAIARKVRELLDARATPRRRDQNRRKASTASAG